VFDHSRSLEHLRQLHKILSIAMQSTQKKEIGPVGGPPVFPRPLLAIGKSNMDHSSDYHFRESQLPLD